MLKERRSSYRYRITAYPVTLFLTETVKIQGLIEEVSDKGLFIATDQDFHVGNGVYFSILFPQELGAYQWQGEVRFVRWQALKSKRLSKGVGVELKFPTAIKGEIWKSFIKYLKEKHLMSVTQRIIDELFKRK